MFWNLIKGVVIRRSTQPAYETPYTCDHMYSIYGFSINVLSPNLCHKAKLNTNALTLTSMAAKSGRDWALSEVDFAAASLIRATSSSTPICITECMRK